MANADYIGDPNDPIRQAVLSQPGFVGVFRNNLYQVEYREIDAPEWKGKVAWLCIRRHDSEAVHDWRHLQQIKNDLCGPEAEALEIYPAESRLVDTSNQYHLFVLPPGTGIPFGYAERDVSDIPFGKNKNRPFDKPPSDLNARGAAMFIDGKHATIKTYK
jgi:hypothetical protein